MSEQTRRTEQGKRRTAEEGLHYVDEFEEGISRRRRGRGFTYQYASGRTVKAKGTLRRIEALAIPPAWEKVWICRRADGHIQARGRDQAGRRQYIYHGGWEAMQAAAKFDRMHVLGSLLPRLRRRVRRDLNDPGLSKRKVLATVVRLIDKSHLRVGGKEYATNSGARGATTLAEEHVEVEGRRISLDYPGKGGRPREINFSDRKVARVIEKCSELDGQFLFAFCNEDGEPSHVESTDINTYLRATTKEQITAKDFRTWWGSVIACDYLADAMGDEAESSEAKRVRVVTSAIDAAAEALGNTRAVCKSSYVHPGLQAAGRSGELPALFNKVGPIRKSKRELTLEETTFLRLLPHLEVT